MTPTMTPCLVKTSLKNCQNVCGTHIDHFTVEEFSKPKSDNTRASVTTSARSCDEGGSISDLSYVIVTNWALYDLAVLFPVSLHSALPYLCVLSLHDVSALKK